MLVYFLTYAKDLLSIQYFFIYICTGPINKILYTALEKKRKMFEMFGENAPQLADQFKAGTDVTNLFIWETFESLSRE